MPLNRTSPGTMALAGAKSRTLFCDWIQVLDFDLVSFRITAYSEHVFGATKFHRWDHLTEEAAKSQTAKALQELDLNWHVMEVRSGDAFG